LFINTNKSAHSETDLILILSYILSRTVSKLLVKFALSIWSTCL